MFEHFENEKARKKSMTTVEKKEAKAAKDALEAPYTHCMLDGRKEKVGNFRVEPPGLFRGRGDHPKKGKLKVGGLPAPRWMFADGSRSFVCNQRISRSISATACLYQSPTFLVIGRRLCMTRPSPGLRTGLKTSTAIISTFSWQQEALLRAKAT